MIPSVASTARRRTRLPVRVTSAPGSSACPRLRYRSSARAAASGSSTSGLSQVQAGAPAARPAITATAASSAAPPTARRYRRRLARGPCRTSGPSHAPGGPPTTSAATAMATCRGAGGSSTEPPRSAPCPTRSPVVIAMQRAPRAARSSSGSLISAPRSRPASIVVARVVSRPRVTASVPSGRRTSRKPQNTAM